MARGNIYTAIDIGTNKITTIIVSEDIENGRRRVVGVATETSKGIRKSQVVDIEDTVEVVTRSVEAAERMAGFSISEAFISVGGVHIQSQNSKGVVAVSNSGEEIVEADVERVIEAARAISLPSSREIIHVIPRDYNVDSQPGIKDPLSMTGVRLEVEAHIITGASTAIRNLVKCITEIGVNVSGLVFSGLAASEAVLTSTEKELGVCMIDIGGGSTSLAVYIEGSLSHSSVLPIGAKHITNDLAIGLRISLEQAEKIKLVLSDNKKESLLKNPEENSDVIDLDKYGIESDMSKASYKTMVEGIIRPRLNEIFAMVKEEIKKSELLALTPAGVVLSGGGALTIGVTDACKRTLSMPVRVVSLSQTQRDENELTGLLDDIQSPIYAVSQGLVYYAINQASDKSNVKTMLPHFGNLVDRFPGRGVFSRVVDFIKSFLP